MKPDLEAIASLEYGKAVERITRDTQTKLVHALSGMPRGGQVDALRARIYLDQAKEICEAYSRIWIELLETRNDGCLNVSDVAFIMNKVRGVAGASKRSLTTSPRSRGVSASAAGDISRQIDGTVASINRDLQIRLRRQAAFPKQPIPTPKPVNEAVRLPDIWIVDPLLIEHLATVSSSHANLSFLVSLCREINSSRTDGNIVATVLLMRAVLNHVPPAFGYETFEQVVANTSKSLKESFEHLEMGLRKVADFHTHRKITTMKQFEPSPAQVDPFKPQFELVLQQVVSILSEERK